MAMAARVAFMAATRDKDDLAKKEPTPAWLLFVSEEIASIIPDELTMVQAEEEKAKHVGWGE